MKVNQDSLPTEIRPFYRVIDADDLGELEDLMTDFLHEYDTSESKVVIIGSPKLIQGDEDEGLYWIQTCLVDKYNKNE